MGECDGREEVAKMLQLFYRFPFDAHKETMDLFVSGKYAFSEGLLMKKHLDEFEGIARKLVSVSIAVSCKWRIALYAKRASIGCAMRSFGN
jgi:hypothetical protein